VVTGVVEGTVEGATVVDGADVSSVVDVTVLVVTAAGRVVGGAVGTVTRAPDEAGTPLGAMVVVVLAGTGDVVDVIVDSEIGADEGWFITARPVAAAMVMAAVTSHENMARSRSTECPQASSWHQFRGDLRELTGS
jgi:hypothetical protein